MFGLLAVIVGVVHARPAVQYRYKSTLLRAVPGWVRNSDQTESKQLLPLFLTRPQMSGVCPLCPRKWTPIGNKLWVSEFMSVRDWRKSTAAALAPGGFSIPTPGQPCEKFDIGTLTYINAFVLLSRAHNFG
jgi:hypothetical protein